MNHRVVSPRSVNLIVLLLLTLTSAFVPSLQSQPGQVVISEFMASNSSTLMDEDGSFEDWIELHNTGPTAVNLRDWSLTDEPALLTKWRFPTLILGPDQYLVVFASGKDRRHPESPLHTSFGLARDGDYLALVEPDGDTIASEFAPAFPPQVQDVSYGLDTGLRGVQLLATNASGRALIPTDDSLALDWTLPDFDDSGWIPVESGVGFVLGAVGDQPLSGLTNSLVGYWPFDDASGLTATDSSGLGNHGTLTGFRNDESQWVSGKYKGALQFGGFSEQDYVRVPNYPKATTALSVAAWVFAESRPSSATVAKNWSDASRGQFHFGLRSPEGDLDVFIRTTTGVFVAREGASTPLPTGTWQHVAFTADSGVLRLFRNGVQVASSLYTGTLESASVDSLGIGVKLNSTGATASPSNPGYWHGAIDDLAIWNRGVPANDLKTLADVGRSTAFLGSDLRTAMHGVNSTCYLRFPIVLDNPDLLTRWLLDLRYNDGVVSWVNGQELLRRNAPDELAWNSQALQAQPEVDPIAFEQVNLSAVEEGLRPGTNTLAFQGLNVDKDQLDLLVQLSLNAFSVTNTTNMAAYFTLPTPGAENLVGVEVLGPVIRDPVHTPLVPMDDEDLNVQVHVTPSFGAVTNVTMFYRVMYEQEIALQMFDDGAHGDGAPGDGLFGASIPASASAPGQMVRYYFAASDHLGRTSRAPIFNDPIDSDEYFGTIVQDPSNRTPLPVFHWFIERPPAAETLAGSRCSLFFNGELYDNIFVRIRGGTSINWPKKSYKIEFNEDHEFLLRSSQRRVTEIDLNTTYTDKSYVRAVLTYEMMRDAELPAPEIFPAQLRQNTEFYSVTLYTENPDKDFLINNGLDRNGAFYKGGPGSNMQSPTSFIKKTRREENRDDLNAFLAGVKLTGEERERFYFDNVDLAEVANYMATMAVSQDIDGTDKNYFIYRDTEGTQEWQITPWDIDLTFGPDALNTDRIVFDQQDASAQRAASHPFIGARPYTLSPGKFQYLIEGMERIPRTRQMVLRRVRTLTEEFLMSGYFQNRIEELFQLLDADVALDQAKWANLAHFGTVTFTLREALDRIKNEYLTPRVGYLTGPNIVGVLSANPGSQPLNTVVDFCSVVANPRSPNQAQEYFCLTNPAPFPVDLSGWRITGAVDYNLRPGTVIPSNSVLYLSPDVVAFRARTSGPSGGQSLFVQGNYSGQLSARGETLQLLDPLDRVIQTHTYPGNPTLAQQFLRITELMYNPASPSDDPLDAEPFEFVELKNISEDTTLDLRGIRFSLGLDFRFAGSAVTSLAPGDTVLVVKNLAAFTARYGAGLNVAGEYTGRLDNGGERLKLLDKSGEEILDFSYDNNWYPITDGLGFSLEIVDQHAQPDAWGEKSSWRVSAHPNGSPGLNNPAPPDLPKVVVNEVLAWPGAQAQSDNIELHNPGGTAADIGGWYLTDRFEDPKKFVIPNGTSLAAGGYLVFTEADFNPTPGVAPSFGLSSGGEEVWIFSADSQGELTGYVHGFNFGPSAAAVSFGRLLTSNREEHFVAQTAFTPGAVNSGPSVGPVVIDEIMYNPAEAGGGQDVDAEYVELLNITPGPIPLFDTGAAEHTWRLTEGVTFEFPVGTALQGGESVLVVRFDPLTNAPALAAFRATYNLDESVRLFGPYDGRLNNGGENLELKRPTSLSNDPVFYTLMDAVAYDNSVPWPEGANGGGLSLQRRASADYGNDPVNWTAAPPTPGRRGGEGGSAPSITLQPQSMTVLASESVSLHVEAQGTQPLSYQWQFRGSPIANATNSNLVFAEVSGEHHGDYQVLVYNHTGSALSTVATLTVLHPLTFLAMPESHRVRSGDAADVTFSVLAYSPSPLTYQWLFNGVNVFGATNSSLTITNVGLDQMGDYSVTVTDDVSSLTSDPGNLLVMIAPVIVVHPISQTVAPGATVVLSVQMSNSVTVPIGYRWRRAGRTREVQSLFSLNSFHVATNVQETFTYDVIVTNIGNLIGIRSARTTITVVPDGDGDLMPDAWETANGLNPEDPADATLDKDGDGATNLDEHLAGTDPGDAASYLRLIQEDPSAPTVLQFHAVSNRTYTVEWKESVDYGQWSKLLDLPALPTNRDVLVTDPYPPAAGRLYRLSLPWQNYPVPGPIILKSPRLAVVDLADDIKFEVSAVGRGNLQYQWFHNGQPLADATDATLVVGSSQVTDMGGYEVVVRDDEGSATNVPPAILAVRPAILAQPENQILNAGESAQFTVTAVGLDPLQYRWTHDGKVLPGETNPILTISGLQPSDAGVYQVNITHQTPLGPVGIASREAVLNVR